MVTAAGATVADATDTGDDATGSPAAAMGADVTACCGAEATACGRIVVSVITDGAPWTGVALSCLTAEGATVAVATLPTAGASMVTVSDATAAEATGAEDDTTGSLDAAVGADVTACCGATATTCGRIVVSVIVAGAL